MATPYKLVRNSRVFFTTNVDATTGVIPSSGASITTDNTIELQVLDGFSFSQATQQTTIQLNEAGNTPARGQRSFNISLDPVEFTFTTYVRPYNNSGTILAEESVLWNAIFSSKAIDSTNNAVAVTATAVTRASTATNVATFTITSTNFTTKGIATGDVVSIGGLLGNYANEWNAPATITLTPSDTAATAVSVAYLAAPIAAAGTAPATATGSITIASYAWTAHAATGTAPAVPAYSQVHTGGSNKNTLQKFGLYIAVDDIIYAIDNACLDQASIDFGLDGIAQIAWTGKGLTLRQLASTAIITGSVFSGAGNATGTAASKNTAAAYITNKLSTMKLISKIGGNDGSAGTSYNIAITGGNLTIANNISYVVPANLGVVNTAIGYFTGTRSITGNVTAYLKTGTNFSAQLLSDILAGTTTTSETKFRVQLEVGGASNTVHVDFNMPGVVLQVPSLETQDIMSTTINFTAQGFDPIAALQSYDLGQTNDLTIKYYA